MILIAELCSPSIKLTSTRVSSHHAAQGVKIGVVRPSSIDEPCRRDLRYREHSCGICFIEIWIGNHFDKK